MARPKKIQPDAAEGTLTVLKEDTISDGFGGFLKVGAKFDAADEDAATALIARGFAK